MSINQIKWRATQEKVAFLKQFPGLFYTWEEAVGQTIQSVIPFGSNSQMAVITFTNRTFTVASLPAREPHSLRNGVETARPALERMYPEACASYDRLAARDKECTRLARLENILGAISNNMEEIPELKDRIQLLIKEWNS